MGIIQKQAVKGSIYSYIGVVAGFITTALLFPHILSAEEIGLLKLLVSFSLLFAQFGSLGFGNVISRLFPYFRDKESGHRGFVLLALLITTMGFLVSIAGLELLKPLIIRNNIRESALFVEYINYLYPLIFFTVFFNFFDSYIIALYDAVIGLVLKELVQRVLILGSVLLYFMNILSFQYFVLFYIFAFSIPTVILMIILFVNKQLTLTLPGSVFTVRMWKDILNLCFHGIIAGFGSVIFLQLDSIIVNHFLGISSTGIYATTLYFATLVIIPSRPLIKIAVTILAEAWKRDDLSTIALVYRKSCINQSIISVLIFIGLWVNIDNIFEIIPPAYAAGKWIIFFGGLANVIEMSTGANAAIIQTSRYYRANTPLIFVTILILVFSAIPLIKIFGLTGAGISILLTISVTNFLRFLFLKWKFGLQPFSYRMLHVFIIGGTAYFAGYLFPEGLHFIPDILIRSLITGLIFLFCVVFFNISEDINEVVYRVFRYFSGKRT